VSHPELAGVAVAVLEIAIGVLVLLGFLTRIAAAAGLVLNLVLFLTASWHTSPYFLGSDIVFVFAWLPLVLSGPRGSPRSGTCWRAARSLCGRRWWAGERSRFRSCGATVP
jgi:thiosulfate dehydrogenase [quinone] large subunit